MVDPHTRTTFQYSSTLSSTGENIVAGFGTAEAGLKRVVQITDFSVSSGGTAGDIQILGKGGGYQTLNFRIPANGNLSYTWSVPYRLEAISSTGQARGIVASASAIGIKYSVTGYIDK